MAARVFGGVSLRGRCYFLILFTIYVSLQNKILVGPLVSRIEISAIKAVNKVLFVNISFKFKFKLYVRNGRTDRRRDGQKYTRIDELTSE